MFDARGPRGLDTCRRVLEHRATTRVEIKRRRASEIRIRSWFSVLGIFSGDNRGGIRNGCRGQPSLSNRAGSGGDDGPRTRRTAGGEFGGPVDRSNIGRQTQFPVEEV